MPYDSVSSCFFVFRYEICRARKSDLRNIRFHFFFRHADPVIFYGKRFRFFVRCYCNTVNFFVRGFSERI